MYDLNENVSNPLNLLLSVVVYWLFIVARDHPAISHCSHLLLHVEM